MFWSIILAVLTEIVFTQTCSPTTIHRENLHWMSEVVNSNGEHIGHIDTDDQARDIFTKASKDPVKCVLLFSLVGVHQNNIIRSHRGSSTLFCTIRSPAVTIRALKVYDKMDGPWVSSWRAESGKSQRGKWPRRSACAQSARGGGHKPLQARRMHATHLHRPFSDKSKTVQ